MATTSSSRFYPKRARLWMLLGLIVFLTPAVRAAISYDNSASPTGIFHDSRQEYGDEISLFGANRHLTTFQFEYFASFTPSSTETAQVRFYANDGTSGPNGTTLPSTLLYDSGPFTLESGYHTITISALNLHVPDTFTWSVQFGGLDSGEKAGLLLYGPPTVGSSRDDFWEREGDEWLLKEFPEAEANFAARVQTITTALPNDDFANAIELPSIVEPITIQGTTVGATSEVYDPPVLEHDWWYIHHWSQAPGAVDKSWTPKRGGSLWYRWTAPTTGIIEWVADYGNVSVGFYTGDSLMNLERIPVNDQPLRVTAGTQYHLTFSLAILAQGLFGSHFSHRPRTITLRMRNCWAMHKQTQTLLPSFQIGFSPPPKKLANLPFPGAKANVPSGTNSTGPFPARS